MATLLPHWPDLDAAAFAPREGAREELVAEISAAYVCASLGIVPTVRHADYIAGWLDLLRADNRAIFRAASAASPTAAAGRERDGCRVRAHVRLARSPARGPVDR